jgi:rod shape-determining protein MreB
MVIGIPSCITEVERRAVEESAYKAGAREVIVIEESRAAAIGADIPIWEPAGHMICDIGGGTTEISVISLGGMVVTNAIRLGGDEFDEAIIKHVRNVHNLIIGEQTAERLKVEIGNASPDKTIEKVEIKGTDAITGLPRRLEIDSVEVREALKDPITQIIDEIKATLGQTPPELAADIVERGIVMTGGGSLLKGLGKLISSETGVPVILAERPLDCVALGAGKYFEYTKGFDNSKSIYDSLNG